MADNTRVIVGCSSAEDNPDAVAVSYLTAGAALEQGREVLLWLTSDGVRLGLQGYADGIRTEKDPPASRLHQQFIENGGALLRLPDLLQRARARQAQLVENAELKGASPLMEFATPGTVTFTY